MSGQSGTWLFHPAGYQVILFGQSSYSDIKLLCLTMIVVWYV
jgi:hypothetical protein